MRILVPLLTIVTLAAQPLKLEKRIPLNVKGRIDHMAADVKGNRLFIAALENNTVEVVDLTSGQVSNSIKGLQNPQGVYYWPNADRLYVANATNGRLNVFDGHTFQPYRTYDFDGDADNIRFDLATKEIYVGYGNGALGVINADLGTRVGDTMLTAHPESFQIEQNGPRIFVNVPDAGLVAVIDRRTRTVKEKWPIGEAQQNFPMALDEANHRLFIGCRKPAKLLVLDTASGKQVAQQDIVGDTDDLFYDSDKKRIYVAGGGGSITVIQQKDPDHYEQITTIPTAPKARTALFIPSLKRFCVAVPRVKKQPAELLIFTIE